MLLRANGYAPHGYCLLWQPGLIWTHVISDALIAAAYFSIPVALVVFVRTRKGCGLRLSFLVLRAIHHGLRIWVKALVKLATAAISVATAIALWPLLPKALAIPSPQQLELANHAPGRG